jgi:hypothetical protein
MKKLFLGLLLAAAMHSAYAIDLSPNSNGGSGNIPAGHSVVNFKTGDGNWAATITLPASATQGDVINIISNASYNSNIITTNTDYPLGSMLIKKGETVSFVYQGAQGRWSLTSIPQYTPNATGATIPTLGSNRVVRYSMSEGNRVKTIYLPASANDNAIILIDSTAAQLANIDPTNLLQASTFRVQAGDLYALIYSTKQQKWLPVVTPIRKLNARQTGSVIPVPTAPKTEVSFNADNWRASITLPDTAGDRDRIFIKSSATRAAVINNTNLEFQGTLAILEGSNYEFMFVKDKNLWVIQNSNTDSYLLKNVPWGEMAAIRYPVTRVSASVGNWRSALKLPDSAKPGDRVIVQSDYPKPFTVTATQASFVSQTINQGDTVRFIRNAANQWTVESSLINMLLVYSDQAAARLGASAMKARLLEGVRLTNEAAENSLANFYLRVAGVMQQEMPGETLGEALSIMRSNTPVQEQRNLLAADAVYYEGTESGCGLAYVNQNPSAYNMAGTGSLNCGTTVMRHEFGHNMGLNHGGEPSAAFPYAQGYSKLATVMGGNAIPYFSTPKLYTKDLGLALGVEDQIDAVRMLNRNAPAVSQFR